MRLLRVLDAAAEKRYAWDLQLVRCGIKNIVSRTELHK